MSLSDQDDIVTLQNDDEEVGPIDTSNERNKNRRLRSLSARLKRKVTKILRRKIAKKSLKETISRFTRSNS